MTKFILFFIHIIPPMLSFLFFFFNDTATTEIYTLSLHDALPIFDIKDDCSYLIVSVHELDVTNMMSQTRDKYGRYSFRTDRKSTRLNSSHQIISYAVFCLKKKKIHHYNKLRAPTTMSHSYPVYSH